MMSIECPMASPVQSPTRSSLTRFTRLSELSSLVENGSLKASSKIDVFAVIHSAETQPNDFNEEDQVKCTLLLKNDIGVQPTKCVIYAGVDSQLVNSAKQGTIIRIHRIGLKISTDGQPPFMSAKLNAAGMATVLFSGDPNDDYCPIYTSTDNYSMPPGTRTEIDALRNMIPHLMLPTRYEDVVAPPEIPQTPEMCDIVPFESFVPRKYHNALVQVVEVFMGDRGTICLRCWDTTRLSTGDVLRFTNKMVQEVLKKDEALLKAAGNLCCDVILYGEHGQNALQNVKPRDVVLLRNVHYYLAGRGRYLVIHDGPTSKLFNRGLEVLSGNSRMKTAFLGKIERYLNSHPDLGQTPEKSRNVERPVALVNATAGVSAAGSTVALTRPDLAPGPEQIAPIRNDDNLLAIIVHIQLNELRKHMSTQRSGMQTRSSKNTEQIHQMKIRRATMLVRILLQRVSLLNNYERFKRNLMSSPEYVQRVFTEALYEWINVPQINLYCNKRQALGEAWDVALPENVVKEARTKKTKSGWPCSLDILKGLPTGTKIALQGWNTDLTQFSPAERPLFSLECDVCHHWGTVHVSKSQQYRSCPKCFMNDVHSPLKLNCHFLLTNTKVQAGGMIVNFLFPLAYMRLFTREGDLGETPSDIVQLRLTQDGFNWRSHIENIIKTRMQKSHLIAMRELIIRHCSGLEAFFEVYKIRVTEKPD